jgi:CubicO group peptidase (beta-lactamase class C family)
MPEIQQLVQQAVDDLIASGAERGLQIAAYQHGRPLVDVVGGLADVRTGRAVTPETLFHVTSTGKGLASSVVHVLVERDLFSYDTPLAELWPEFGAHGKEKITVRHVLTHTAGLPAVPADTTVEDLCDWDKMCAVLADATPWWEPGTKTGYHPQTFGYLVGELVRRATGRSISEVMRREVAEPLGLANALYFAVPASELPRVAHHEEPEGGIELTPEMLASLAEQFPFFKVVDGWTAAPPAAMPSAAYCNREDVLQSEIPAGAVMTARGCALLYSALLGEVDGVRLISAERLREATEVAVSGTDETTGFPTARGLGWDIGFQAPLDGPTVFGMAGSGGTAAYADIATGLSIALAKNTVTAGDYTTFLDLCRLITEAATAYVNGG